MAKYFTPIAQKAPANAATFNAPLTELDTQVEANAQQLAEQLSLIQAHAAALQQQLAAIQQNASAIASQGELVEELAADSTVHDQQLEALDGRLDTAEADIQSQGTAINGLSSRVGQAETDIDSLKTAVDGLDDDLTDVATDVSGLKTDMTDVKGRLSTAEGDIDSLETDVDGLDTRVTDLEQAPGYDLPKASAQTLGGVKVGSNLSIDQDGVLSATDTTYQEATGQAAGLMSATDKSKLDNVEAGANAYTLPAATDQSLGGVMVGDGLSIDQDGVLSASGGGGGSDIPIYYGIATELVNGATFIVTVNGLTELIDNMILIVIFNVSINNIGSKYIRINDFQGKSWYLPPKEISPQDVVIFRYSANGNCFRSLLSQYAVKAFQLADPTYIDGVSTNGVSRVKHAYDCNTAAADQNKIASGVVKYPSNTDYTGFFAYIKLALGNTASTIKLGPNNTYLFDVYNQQGGLEMPYIPANGYMLVWYNQLKSCYELVSYTGQYQITAASDTDTALDDLTLNGDYLAVINSVNYKLTNVYNAEDLHEQYLYARPATITPGSTATPVRKYRCREWDATNSEWLGWTEWTVL